MVAEAVVGTLPLRYESGGVGGVGVGVGIPLVSSPRTVAVLSEPPAARMTTNLSVMNDSNDVSGVVLDDASSKLATSSSSSKDPSSGDLAAASATTQISSADDRAPSKVADGTPAKGSGAPQDQHRELGRLTPKAPQQFAEVPLAAGYPHLMPQVGSAAAYYLGYSPAQLPPEPPSPATGGMTTVAYEAGSFFQQPAGAFAPLGSNPAGTPLSPPRPTATMAMGVLPPASPLFPRVASGGRLNAAGGTDRSSMVAPPSPNLVYMASQLGGASMYAQYPMVPGAGSQSSDSPEDAARDWSDRYAAATQNSYHQQSSPQVIPMSYGMPLNTRAAMGGRAYSFEEAMLPPSALDQLDAAVNNPAYSPYGGSQASPVPTGATLFAQQLSWYGGAAAGAGPPPDMYSSPGSPLQPRPSAAHPSLGVYGGGPALRPMAPYGQYYPASSPGPPIQTTASNKGPDGANLFIFHIPNHFTNLDMYQLFCPYGNLLSVRIMVEKDTGRSRGFGFVSYDNPESAALAIKELNGFAIGNKRLKVQHKQIRSKEMLHNGREIGSGGSFDLHGDADETAAVPYPRSQYAPTTLPPSGAMAPQNLLWYGKAAAGGITGPGIGADAAALSSDGAAAVHSGHGDAAAELSTTAATESTGGGGVEGPPSALLGTAGDESSPLASLGSLQSALPDVAGKGESPTTEG